jgi:hypothetical protein
LDCDAEFSEIEYSKDTECLNCCSKNLYECRCHGFTNNLNLKNKK